MPNAIAFAMFYRYLKIGYRLTLHFFTMQYRKYVIRATVFILLTALTQVGGLAYLANFSCDKFIDKIVSSQSLQRALRLMSFLVIYSLTSFIIVPLIARPFGRVRLPYHTTNHLRPATIWTYLLNRNYVRPELRATAFSVAEEMDRRHPGSAINYLDGSFPFINGFSLLPHLSHNDGKKLDISFCYSVAGTSDETNEVPSPIGYGICEEPAPNEINTACSCEQRGYWHYSILKRIVPQSGKEEFTINQQATKELVELFASNNAIGKIFIEPHLVTRLKLTSTKIRFHGCRAVRHDDHIHVQLK